MFKWLKFNKPQLTQVGFEEDSNKAMFIITKVKTDGLKIRSILNPLVKQKNQGDGKYNFRLGYLSGEYDDIVTVYMTPNEEEDGIEKKALTIKISKEGSIFITGLALSSELGTLLYILFKTLDVHFKRKKVNVILQHNKISLNLEGIIKYLNINSTLFLDSETLELYLN